MGPVLSYRKMGVGNLGAGVLLIVVVSHLLAMINDDRGDVDGARMLNKNWLVSLQIDALTTSK